MVVREDTEKWTVGQCKMGTRGEMTRGTNEQVRRSKKMMRQVSGRANYTRGRKNMITTG